MPRIDLPLHYWTAPAWAPAVLARPLDLLNDHAHLEKKAALNALELLHRWPEPPPLQLPPEKWVAAMTAVARDEVEHLAVVCRILARRGGKLTRGHRNEYANALRALVRAGCGLEELVDRLLVSGLIEARSCERFWLLAQTCGEENTPDQELEKLYKGLWASEHGHYKTFVGLAAEVMERAAVEKRWDWMLEKEAAIIRGQTAGPRMHSGEGK